MGAFTKDYVCGVCERPVRYVTRINGSLWLHADTMQWWSQDPWPHDANTSQREVP